MSKKRKKPEADEELPAPAPTVVEDSDDGSTEQATDDFLGEDD